MYSSLTKTTEKITTEDLSNFGIELNAIGDKHTYKFSFAKIKSSAGDVKTVTSLAKTLLKLMTAMGIITSTPLTTIVALVGGIASVVKFVATGSSSSGIYVTVQEYTRRVTKNGKVYSFPDKKIVDIGLY